MVYLFLSFTDQKEKNVKMTFCSKEACIVVFYILYREKKYVFIKENITVLSNVTLMQPLVHR